MKLILLLTVLLVITNAYHLSQEVPFPEEGQVWAVFDAEYYNVAKGLIDNANNSVRLIAFEIKYYDKYQGSKTNALVEALIAADRRGVDVSAVTDEYLNGYGNGADKAVKLLRSHGVDAHLDGEARTTHAKVLIVDGRYVLIGSTNWSFTSIEKNAETNVLVNSPELARQLEAYFDSLVPQ